MSATVPEIGEPVGHPSFCMFEKVKSDNFHDGYGYSVIELKVRNFTHIYI